MVLRVPRIPVERSLRGVERVVQLVSRGEAAGQTMQGAAVGAVERQRLLEFLLGGFEQAYRPQRVGVVGQRFGVGGELRASSWPSAWACEKSPRRSADLTHPSAPRA